MLASPRPSHNHGFGVSRVTWANDLPTDSHSAWPQPGSHSPGLGLRRTFAPATIDFGNTANLFGSMAAPSSPDCFHGVEFVPSYSHPEIESPFDAAIDATDASVMADLAMTPTITPTFSDNVEFFGDTDGGCSGGLGLQETGPFGHRYTTTFTAMQPASSCDGDTAMDLADCVSSGDSMCGSEDTDYSTDHSMDEHEYEHQASFGGVPMPTVSRASVCEGADAEEGADEEAWLAEVPPVQPAGCYSSVEEMITNMVPVQALGLDRKRFNAWKTANNIKFRGEEQRTLTKIRRAVLARGYARRSRERRAAAAAES